MISPAHTCFKCGRDAVGPIQIAPFTSFSYAKCKKMPHGLDVMRSFRGCDKCFKNKSEFISAVEVLIGPIDFTNTEDRESVNLCGCVESLPKEKVAELMK